jgi:hypothetical protein
MKNEILRYLKEIIEAVFFGHFEISWDLQWKNFKTEGLLKIYFWVIGLIIFLILH